MTLQVITVNIYALTSTLSIYRTLFASIVKGDYNPISYAIVDFYLFYDGLLIFKYKLFWQEISAVFDIQVIPVQACGPLVGFFNDNLWWFHNCFIMKSYHWQCRVWVSCYFIIVSFTTQIFLKTLRSLLHTSSGFFCFVLQIVTLTRNLMNGVKVWNNISLLSLACVPIFSFPGYVIIKQPYVNLFKVF